MSGADIVAIARTGSGKTLGFLAPAFSRILAAGPLEKGQGPLALIMAPTRELAQQLVLGNPNLNPNPNPNPS